MHVMCYTNLRSSASVGECELMLAWCAGKVCAKGHPWMQWWVTDNSGPLSFSYEWYSEAHTLSHYDGHFV